MKKTKNPGGMFINIALAFVIIITLFVVAMVKCMPGNHHKDNTSVSTANNGKAPSSSKRVTRTSQKSRERKEKAESTVNLNAGNEQNYFTMPDMMTGGSAMPGPGIGMNMGPMDFGGPMPGGNFAGGPMPGGPMPGGPMGPMM